MRIAPVAEIKAQLTAFIKASEESPIVVTRNGKPVAVLIGTSDEDEIERLILAHSKKLRAVLEAAEIESRRQAAFHTMTSGVRWMLNMTLRPTAHRNDPGEDDLRYHYLVTRPDNDRRQAYLKGHDMTVGQLVYTMRANEPERRGSRRGFELAVGAGAGSSGLLRGASRGSGVGC